MVFKLLDESARQPRKTAHPHSHCEVLALDKRRTDSDSSYYNYGNQLNLGHQNLVIAEFLHGRINAQVAT